MYRLWVILITVGMFLVNGVRAQQPSLPVFTFTQNRPSLDYHPIGTVVEMRIYNMRIGELNSKIYEGKITGYYIPNPPSRPAEYQITIESAEFGAYPATYQMTIESEGNTFWVKQ